MTLYCSFCGKSQHEVKLLIAGPTVFICNECVEVCMDELAKKAIELQWIKTNAPPKEPQPIPMILICPSCGGRHIDEGEFATKVHHTHACQHCGIVWRPAIGPTVGVQFLPGFKNEVSL